jgi:uncharacterized protein (TIGR01319 family)
VSDVRSVIATDCGSTTTKAILIEKNDAGEYRLAHRGEAPTTVEAPVEDVTRGVLNAVRELEELRGRPLIVDERPRADLYVSTSSAGGGLQLIVGGVVQKMTAESAARAALGAGAIVMDALASNDRRLPHEKIERIRQLRPDMILLAGGTDGGTKKHVVALAELVRAAQPRPRLGHGFALPVIYAGNRDARADVENVLGNLALQVVANVRPELEREQLAPARDAIHEMFLEHVMQQAPGYAKLATWTDAPIMPTPGAMGLVIQQLAARRNANVLGVDIGGATTDVFSVFGGVFNRTVSANLGMSYSISNVLADAGIANIQRWVPFALDEHALRDRIGNKMIRPTTIPHTLEELKIEHAIAREALRLSFAQHREFAVALRGTQHEANISDAFEDRAPESLVDLMKLDLVVGSGGVLSHAPRRAQAMMMMIDAFALEGITELAVDSIFMMPHLGVLSTVQPDIAAEVFEKDCLVHLGTCVAPVGKPRRGKPLLELRWRGKREQLAVGEVRRIELADAAECELLPARGVDVGAGPGERVLRQVRGGVVGLVLDGRGRPLAGFDRAAGEALALYPTPAAS